MDKKRSAITHNLTSSGTRNTHEPDSDTCRMRPSLLRFTSIHLIAIAGAICLAGSAQTMAQAPLPAEEAAPPAQQTHPAPQEDSATVFQKVSDRLDSNGAFYAYMDLESDPEYFTQLLNGLWRTYSTANPAVLPLPVNFTQNLDTLGLMSVRALGVSSRRDGDLYLNRYYLYMPEGRKGLFLATGGEPRPFDLAQLVPGDTALAVECDFSLPVVLEYFLQVADFYTGGMGRAMAGAQLGQPVPGMSLTFNDIIQKMDTRMVFTVNLDETTTLAMEDDRHVEIPLPAMFLRLEGMRVVGEDFLANMEARKATGQVEANIVETDRYRGLEFQSPQVNDLARTVASNSHAGKLENLDGFLQPVVAYDKQGTGLYLAVNRSTLERNLQPSETLGNNAEFQDLTAGFPASGNMLAYASSKYFGTMIDVQRQLQELLIADVNTNPEEKATSQAILYLLDELQRSFGKGRAVYHVNTPQGIEGLSREGVSAKFAVYAATAAIPAMIAAVAGSQYGKNRAQAQGGQLDSAMREDALRILSSAEIYAMEQGVTAVPLNQVIGIPRYIPALSPGTTCHTGILQMEKPVIILSNPGYKSGEPFIFMQNGQLLDVPKAYASGPAGE